MSGLRSRFTLVFFDTILILIWLLLLGLLVLGLVFTLVPSLPIFLQNNLSTQGAFVATYLIFFAASATRFVQCWNGSLWLVVIGYSVAQIIFWTMIPNGATGGPIVLGSFFSVLLIPSQYVWDRIKPLEKRRVLRPRLKTAKEEETPIE